MSGRGSNKFVDIRTLILPDLVVGANKGPYSENYGFPVVMYRCENWTIKNAERQRIDASNCGAGEDSWSPLDCKEIKPLNPKGNQP